MSYARVVRLGVLILPELRLPALAERWSRADGLGFDHAWTYDHIAWRDLRDSAWFAAVPTLAAAAMVMGCNPVESWSSMAGTIASSSSRTRSSGRGSAKPTAWRTTFSRSIVMPLSSAKGRRRSHP